MKPKALLLAAVSVALMIVGTASPALAAPAQRVTPNGACSAGDYNYVDTSTGYTFTQASGGLSTVSGDPGVTLSISTSTTFTVSGTLGGNAQISASVVVLTVSEQINISITASYSHTSSNSGSWTVPSTYTNGGSLTIGARKYHGTVSKYAAKVTDCSNGAFISSTSYNAPQPGWYFKTAKL